MSNKLVWVVEDKDGNIKSNWSTGTRIYTRKHNAEQACKKENWNTLRYVVVEYELVPTQKEGVGQSDE
jgi:hypothetical protein